MSKKDLLCSEGSELIFLDKRDFFPHFTFARLQMLRVNAPTWTIYEYGFQMSKTGCQSEPWPKSSTPKTRDVKFIFYFIR